MRRSEMDFPESDDIVGTNNATDNNNNSNAEMAAQKEQILRRILMPEARMRLNNIRMVKPDLANLVEQQLIAMTTQGQIQSQLSDEQLRQLLYSIRPPKRDFKINRI